jgi:hypothetical protein
MTIFESLLTICEQQFSGSSDSLPKIGSNINKPPNQVYLADVHNHDDDVFLSHLQAWSILIVNLWTKYFFKSKLLTEQPNLERKTQTLVDPNC